ncbi:ROK family protein [Pontibacter sp. E15-1]|uniref:ROK family protein n=1 Tax=Pontibacter sp. E15-1 TaxID=2919918 RepID=UPI001F503126|nr:ROK family protein [Pontibacter sp. E15-1]MCJ8164388.1 ROK family protein [Pontibacter sp. E15-1]
MKDQKVVGIDIGGTKVHIGVVQRGQVIAELRIPTAAKSSKEAILRDISDGIRQVIDPEVVGIGIGVPGLVDEKKGIVFDVQNIPSWTEVRLKQHLERAFELPVYITNDANTYALGEKVYGPGKPYQNMIGVTLGTGIGTGIIANNNLYSGAFSCAGEFGGMPYLDKTLEDYCSGKFFLQAYGTPGDEMQALANTGDARAIEAFQQFGHHLGNAIKIMLYALSPEAIFLGGSVSHCYPFFKEAMHKSVADFPYRVVTDKLVIEQSEIKHVAVLGAAALFRMRHQPVPDYT